jgi:hypothetical protein
MITVKILLQKTSLKSPNSKTCLSFNIDKLESVFPGFMLGDFAVLHGSFVVRSLLTRLCVLSQLPYQLGGLETNVLFVDGDNSFRLYDISSLAQRYQLEPIDVLEKIFISRAFTAYQHSSVILDKLEKAIYLHNSKLVLLSSPSHLYLDSDLEAKEAQEIFIQLTDFLSDFTTENQVIVVATNLLRVKSKRNTFFRKVLSRKANVVASIRKINCRLSFVLEKHAFFRKSKTEILSSDATLVDFVRAA